MENDKLIRSAKIIDRLLKIFQGFAAAGIAVSAIFVPLTLIFKDRIIADASHLTLGNLSIHLTGEMSSYLDLAAIQKSILITLAAAIVSCAALWYCLKLLRSILAPMKEGRPFDAGISGKIRSLAWAVLVGGGISEFCRAVSAVFEIKAYETTLQSAFPAADHFSYNYSISFWFAGTALILFFLSYIFRCGEALQQEADETL